MQRDFSNSYSRISTKFRYEIIITDVIFWHHVHIRAILITNLYSNRLVRKMKERLRHSLRFTHAQRDAALVFMIDLPVESSAT